MSETANGVDIAMADINRLDDVLDREALTEVCRSFFDLFGISVRVLSSSGALLADVHKEQSVCRYANTLREGAEACGLTVEGVRQVLPEDEPVIHPCFTGAVYQLASISYQGRSVGRIILGPYLPAEEREVPRSLLTIAPDVDPEEARSTLVQMPRVRAETATRIVNHMVGTIDLILFTSHRAHLTSEMHVSSVRESYRELAEKTSQLQSAYDRLKELDRLKSNFMATVSHELRTPLTSIIGYSEMLSCGIAGDMNEEQKEFVGTIQSKGDHLLKLITNMLDMNKMEQGDVRLNCEPIDPTELLEEVAKTVTPQAQKKGVVIEMVTEDHLPSLAGDPVRLRQVFFNLTDNALKFTPENGTVYLRARATELDAAEDGGLGMVLMAASRPGLEFAIQDTGIGMKDDELPRIFDAFYQVDSGSTREHGGAGLGLSIVKRLVDAHAGKVWVESEVGHGTTFFVALPLSPQPG